MQKEVPEIEEALNKQSIQVGTLEYDARASHLHSWHKGKNQSEIKILLISSALNTSDAEFARRHENMQAEADEHYRILV